jgi:NhaP-type Na+/H+ or K+/H+ antiporter
VTESTTLTLALLVLGWAIVSGALARHNITGPLVFAVAGYLLANPEWGPLDIDVEAGSVHVVAEVTLALVLFSDASRVDVTELRRDVWLPARFLAIGLPLSVAFGSLLAAVFFDVPWALAGFIGAALAPTDAALSAQVINDERVPMRLRRVLNVESGLNDGIATPIVTFMLAVAASQIGVERHSASYEAGQALRELGGGVVVGLIVGFAGAALLVIASHHQWIAPGGRRLATLAVAIASLTAALAIDANGFIAAFVAGITFGAWLNHSEQAAKEVGELPELGGELLALVVWFLFGATLVHVAFDVLDGALVVYAVASLTIIRVLPVALCSVRAGLDRPGVMFIAWFGPRGLASVVFALLAVEELGQASPAVQQAVAAVSLTVLLSVVLHGVTAGPAGRRYAQIEDGRAKS